MSKKYLFVGLILIALIIFVSLINTNYQSKEADIELKVDGGEVEVFNDISGWKTISSDIELNQGDKVKTKKDPATIILFGSSILRLDKETELTLSEVNEEQAKVVITQATGKTWNKVIKHQDMQEEGIRGIKEYTIQMPYAVATVRGTQFSTDAKGIISVLSGKVLLKREKEKGVVEEIEVENATAEISKDESKEQKKIILKKLVKDEWIQKNIENDKKFELEKIEKIKQNKGIVQKIMEKRKELVEKRIEQIKEKVAEQKVSIAKKEVTAQEADKSNKTVDKMKPLRENIDIIQQKEKQINSIIKQLRELQKEIDVLIEQKEKELSEQNIK